MDTKVLAFYLPQFHPIPENDVWWGKGFTEWTNVTKAIPLFRGHSQPRFPADLSYYDLRVPEVREQQAEMAKTYGVDGFVYYHYWFGNGKRLIERPFNEVLESGQPNFPFCLCWANQTWSGVWHGAPNKVLIKQEYPGIADNQQHFKYLFSAFEDARYIKIDGKPLFMVYDINDLPNPKQFADQIKDAAIKAGFKGVYLMASNIVSDDWDMKQNNFDGKVSNAFNKSFSHYLQKYSNDKPSILKRISGNVLDKYLHNKLRIIDHNKLVEHMLYLEGNGDSYPIVVPNWDNTPRSGRRGVILQNSSADLFKQQIKKSIAFLSKNNSKEKLLFVKSWNEWAEGNYLEPDTRDGYAYLEVLKGLKNSK